MKKNSVKLFIFIIIGIIVVYITVFVVVMIINKGDFYVNIKQQENNENNQDNNIITDNTKSGKELNLRYSSAFSPKIGNPDSKLSFIMFFDFDCVYCKQQYMALRDYIKKYKDYVYFEFRHMPFDVLHENTYNLSNAAMCANAQGKFWDMLDEMYMNFDTRAYSLKESKEIVNMYAKNIGLDMGSFNDCYINDRYENVIKKDYVDGLSFGVSATPTMFINGRKISGVIDDNNLKELFSLISIEK